MRDAITTTVHLNNDPGAIRTVNTDHALLTPAVVIGNAQPCWPVGVDLILSSPTTARAWARALNEAADYLVVAIGRREAEHQAKADTLTALDRTDA